MSFLPILALWTSFSCATPLPAMPQEAQPQATVADAYAQVRDTVVTIYTLSELPSVESHGQVVSSGGTGSGVVVTEDGHILTAAHVVQTASKILVEFHEGSRVLATIISSDPLIDLALLRLEDDLPPGVGVAKLGDSDKPRIGSQVFAVGAPLGVARTLTVGYLSARRVAPSMTDPEDTVEVLQTDAAINPGNSGGPLFSMNCEVIGVISYINTRTGGNQGLGFAVSANTVQERFLNQPPLWSGMDFLPVRGRFAEILNVPDGEAALLVQRVVKDSLADKLGLKGGEIPAQIADVPMLLGGDLILAIQGVHLGHPGAGEAGREKLASLGDKDEVVLKIFRAGKEMELRAAWGDLQ